MIVYTVFTLFNKHSSDNKLISLFLFFGQFSFLDPVNFSGRVISWLLFSIQLLDGRVEEPIAIEKRIFMVNQEKWLG